ncbi:two-component system regulatory protein YycI [Carnobacterium pleistocenium]|uniref:two-component system regulatory protein YycI n=1 Tax=Carnobacterium pleistocenium TaxID=181073 RepID=UPI00055081B2|nr:two-component system regulatory protein YycI [Carnobacterium pleistocenium]
MDFKRIQIIFIITFIFLNTFLIFTYFDKNESYYTSSSNQEIDFIEEMENENINLPDFSEAENKVPYVQAETNNLLEDNVAQLKNLSGTVEKDGSLYSSLLSNPLTLSEDLEIVEEDIELLNKFVLSDQVLYGKEYQYFSYNSSDQKIKYTQIANNIPIADGTSEIVFHLNDKRQVISYDQTFAGPVTVQGESRNLITDKNAVEILYQNDEIPASATVKKPVLTYSKTLLLQKLSMYAPVWYIEVTNSGTIEYKRVDALSGSIIRANISEDSTAEEAAVEESINAN